MWLRSNSHYSLLYFFEDAFELKSLHKLLCYLGQTSVSKHMVDLEPQLPCPNAAFVLCVRLSSDKQISPTLWRRKVKIHSCKVKADVMS